MFEEKFHFILFFKIPLQTILERTQSRIFVHFSCLRCFAHNLLECTGIEIPTKTIAKRTIFIVFIVSFSVLSQQPLRKPEWWQESLPFWRHFSDVNAWKHFNASFNEFSWNKTHWMFCYVKLNKIKHFKICTHAEHSENKKLKYIFLLNQNFAMTSTHPDSISLKASLIYHELYNRALLEAWIHTAAFFNKNARLIQSGWNVSYLRKNYLPNIFFGEKSAITSTQLKETWWRFSIDCCLHLRVMTISCRLLNHHWHLLCCDFSVQENCTSNRNQLFQGLWNLLSLRAHRRFVKLSCHYSQSLKCSFA